VSFVALRDNVDLSTPAGRLMMRLLDAMAEFERGLIQERVVADIAAARKRGVKSGVRRPISARIRSRRCATLERPGARSQRSSKWARGQLSVPCSK
jgi:DNA invertase Pin-like site-specific DNA recombinase